MHGVLAGDALALALMKAVAASLQQIQDGARLDCLYCGQPFTKVESAEAQPNAFIVIRSERA